jgi:hypothetical protein
MAADNIGIVVIRTKTQKCPTYSYCILVLGLIIVNTLLAWGSILLSRIISPSLPKGFALVYIAAAFMLLFTLWFGMYGAISAYVGGFIGSGLLSGMPFTVALYFSLANLWMVLIPLFTFRYFKVNVGMESGRDLFHLLLFGTIINNIVSAAWGAATLALGGIIAWSAFGSVFVPWLVGNIVIILLIVPLALSQFTERVSKSKVFVKNYWF